MIRRVASLGRSRSVNCSVGDRGGDGSNLQLLFLVPATRKFRYSGNLRQLRQVSAAPVKQCQGSRGPVVVWVFVSVDNFIILNRPQPVR